MSVIEPVVRKDAIEYPEALRDLGDMVGILQGLLKPYGGDARLDKIIDITYDPFAVDGSGDSVIAVVEAGVKIWYDPQKFHQALLEARRQAERAAKQED
jgi:hypothetical protein